MGNSKKTARLLVGRILKATVASVFGLVAGTAAWPETLRDRLTYNTYGVPGLVDMPTAEMPADADLAGTFSNVGGTTRTTLSFQILPRLSGSFRYSTIVDGVTGKARLYDRSFDLRYQLLTEGDYRPSVVIGLQDFIGTGIYGGEYIVATKTLAPGLKVTGGLGWGRLGSYQAIGATGTRPALVVGTGGTPTYDQWFRGDVAPFAGLSYAYNDRLKFKLEYSSDDYDYEGHALQPDQIEPVEFRHRLPVPLRRSPVAVPCARRRVRGAVHL